MWVIVRLWGAGGGGSGSPASGFPRSAARYIRLLAALLAAVGQCRTGVLTCAPSCTMAGRIASLSTSPSTSNGSSLEAWYPNTAPSPPTRLLLPTSGLTWRPSRVLGTTLQDSPGAASPGRLSGTTLQEPPLQGGSRTGSPGLPPAHSPFHGSLRYHSEIGWHYRYFKPFKIIGKPYPPSLVRPCAIPVPAGLGVRDPGTGNLKM